MLIPIIDFGQTGYWQANLYTGKGANIAYWHFSIGG